MAGRDTPARNARPATTLNPAGATRCRGRRTIVLVLLITLALAAFGCVWMGAQDARDADE